MDVSKFAGIYDTYPDLTGKRQAEGGTRLLGQRKESQPHAPLVTVITVCWNSAETIEQTILSMRAQTYSNFEHVIVDGNSSDATLDILRQYEDGLAYYVSEPDKGIYDAMNKGIELAQGELILLLNSDDWYEPNAVERLVAAWQYSGCDFVGALARYIREDGGSSILPSMTYDHSVLLRMPLRHETMLIPATFYDRIGRYDLSYPIIGDYDLTIRLFLAGATYFELREPLLNFRTTGVSNTDTERLHAEHGDLLQKTFPFLSVEEVEALRDHSKAQPEDFITIANAHLDQPAFVKATQAMIRDFGALWGGPWAAAPLDTLGAQTPGRYPRISIVMPVYNAAALLRDTVAAALAHDFEEIELICVDDCSTDGSLAVLQELSEAHPRLRVLQNLTNKGPGGSRNAGIRAAHGDYVFFLDADDRLPEGALRALYETAQAHDSAVIRGAFHVERRIHGQKESGIKYPAGVSGRVVEKTTLAEMPELLGSTEGHWAALYDRNFVETILYPEDFRMGEDSLFLIKAMAFAPSVSLIPEPVYVYQDSETSAMNTYTFGKYLDEVEWRSRAWSLLNDVGQRDRGDFFLFDWWNPPFFAELEATLSDEEQATFYKKLFAAFSRAGAADGTGGQNAQLQQIFHDGFVRHGLIAPLEEYKIAVLTTFDHGGAGIASQRCMDVLRDAGQGAFTICGFKRGDNPNAFVAPLIGEPAAAHAEGDMQRMWDSWSDIVAVPTLPEDGDAIDPNVTYTTARELFSRTDSMVDAVHLGDPLSQSDIVHLHWVVGMLDFARFEETFGDRPVVWTLHDMNPFTGGCHYTEGCEGYREECRECPLLTPGSTLAHEAWKAKREAYAKIDTLHIVTPSQWLADCAKASSLFGDRDVHVIPNAIPIEHFKPTNKMVARLALGLPLDAKLIVFGADSLNNSRKGGDILVEAARILKDRGPADNVEGVFFGSASLEMDIPVHNMGYISDPARLSLVYAAADVFAFPSREDNAPQTVPESLLSGTPIVSFPVGNAPELIDHMETGFIARYEDAAHFAEGLAWALENPRSPEALLRGLHAHIRAFEYHQPKITADMHMALFRKILEARSSEAGTA